MENPHAIIMCGNKKNTSVINDALSCNCYIIIIAFISHNSFAGNLLYYSYSGLNLLFSP